MKKSIRLSKSYLLILILLAVLPNPVFSAGNTIANESSPVASTKQAPISVSTAIDKNVTSSDVAAKQPEAIVDYSTALLEQTGIFSIIVIVAMTLMGLFNYQTIQSRFNEQIKSTRDALGQEYKEEVRKLREEMRQLQTQLIEEDEKRDRQLSGKIEKESAWLESRINDAISRVYRSTAYACEATPDIAMIWMLRSVDLWLQSRAGDENIATDFILDRLDEVETYATGVTSKESFEDTKLETLEILDKLAPFGTLTEVVTKIRVQINRILSLES